eukprot:4829499-Amphidinium_carterae.1
MGSTAQGGNHCVWRNSTHSTSRTGVNEFISQLKGKFVLKHTSFLTDGSWIQFIGRELFKRNQSVIELSTLDSFLNHSTQSINLPANPVHLEPRGHNYQIKIFGSVALLRSQQLQNIRKLLWL